jgi:hypothetical protein
MTMLNVSLLDTLGEFVQERITQAGRLQYCR